MLRKATNYLVILMVMAAMLWASAWAETPAYDPCTGALKGTSYKAITKVKPPSSKVLKIKPYSRARTGLGGISRLNPMNWWQECCLPMPAKRQFVLGPRVFFARLQGEAQRGLITPVTALEASVADFNDHLGLPKSGNAIWSIMAHYQFQPRWGLRYSFTPISISGSGLPKTSFTFADRTFTAGSPVSSKWERWEHRAGLVFNVSRSVNTVASVFAEWLYIQDKLTVGGGTGITPSVTWDDDKNLAVLGIEFNKCLTNYRGSTLALGCKGSIAFLDDAIGYDAEASLSYLIPVKRGRFGYVKGGYRYAQLKQERDASLFATTMDGAFVEVGFLF